MSARQKTRVHRAVIFVAGFLIATTISSHAEASDTSSWDGDQRSTVRLIAGSAIGKVFRGGIEIKLGPGWKTYWRYPGDAGIPPRFSFAGSENVKAVTVAWPAPQRFSEESINLIGYKGDVVLPLRIVPEDAGKDVTLRVKLDYGICEKLCILAEASVELVLTGGPSSYETALTDAEARVPKQVGLAEGRTLSIRDVRREVGTTRSRVVVDIAAQDTSNVDLFVEGPTSDWALPLPDPISAQPGLRRFAFDLIGFPAGTEPVGAVLKFTAVSGEEAIEVSTHLK